MGTLDFDAVAKLGLALPDVAEGSAYGWPVLTSCAAIALALESIVLVSVHVRYRETTHIILSVALGLVMAFVAYGRIVLNPILWQA